MGDGLKLWKIILLKSGIKGGKKGVRKWKRIKIIAC